MKELLKPVALSGIMAISGCRGPQEPPIGSIPVELSCPGDETFTTGVSGPAGTRFTMLGNEILLADSGIFSIENNPHYVIVKPDGKVGLGAITKQGPVIIELKGAVEPERNKTTVEIKAYCLERE